MNKKLSTKFNTHLTIKITLHKVGIERTYLNINKGHILHYKPRANIVLNGEKQSISSKSRNKTRVPHSLLFNIVLEVLTTTVKEEKEIKGIQIGKEVKLSLFADDMIVCMENPKNATTKLLQLMNEFIKVAGYKINKQKSLALLYTTNERLETEIKETIPFIIATKRTKYQRINLFKEAKYLYAENY